MFSYEICFRIQSLKLKPSLTDAEDPTIQNCPKNQSLETNPGQSIAVVTWSELEATDNSGQNLTVTCSVESGSQFGIGEIAVVCQAVDLAGNRATCMFTVKITGKPIRLFSNVKCH